MIRVLVVDDSAVVRRALALALGREDDIEVVGTAADAYAAREAIARLRPDVVTLDVGMPRMDGLAFLEKLMRHCPLPVVVVSALAPAGSEAAARALALGAAAVVAKPGGATGGATAGDVARAVRAVARGTASAPRPVACPTGERTPPRVLALGASTGGTQALEAVLRALPATAPGTLVVQHMPASFTGAFARRLDRVGPLAVREAADGDAVVPGVALVAPGGRHMLLRRAGAGHVVRLRDGPPVHHQRPSVDVLFESVARHAGAGAVGALLTGMGADGAAGLLAMRRAGAHTIAQDEATCVVFGMPGEAVRRGAAAAVLPLDAIAAALGAGGRAT